MRRIILTSICWIILTAGFGQNASELFQKGQEAIKAEEFDEAISYFDKSIALKDDEFVVWYSRAIVKGWQKRFEEAILDFDQSIKLNPAHKKSYNGRACAKQDITDYDGAIADFNQAIKIDDKYIDAIYNRATLYDLLGKRDEACKDFNSAFKLGDEQAKRKVERCKEAQSKDLHPIIRLTKTAENDKYGFSSDNPIKVGPGPDGGPANQRAYLNLLRDVNGKPINYERVESCCDYKSENGFFGMAKLDKYEIYYTDEKGKDAKSFVYISMYDFEEPQILFGFKTVGQK
jgi:tetratricopeptide (TPR) repeat protein